MDIIDIDEVLGDDSFIGDTERLDDEVVEILKQWKSCSTFPSSNAVPAAASSSFGFGSTNHYNGNNNSSSSTSNSNNNHHSSSFSNESKGSKYIDTRTFTRPKKKLDSTFNSANVTLDLTPVTREHSLKVPSPLLNLKIGGAVTPATGAANTSQMMQKSWLNDVSPPGSIMSSMEFSLNEKMGNSLITSGDFSNVSFLLNANASGGEEMRSNYDGYKLADVIKDRQFLENLSCFDDNTMTKDCAISKTDLNGIEENLSGLSTMQNSLESVTKCVEGRLSDVTMVLDVERGDATFELLPGEAEPIVREKINSTFERRRNFDTYRKPKSSLNGTFDALPKVDTGESVPANLTFDAGEEEKLSDATFGMVENCNGTFSLNKTAKVSGTEKQLNQTYEYCEKVSPGVHAADRTFERPKNETFVEDPASPDALSILGNRTPNGTFELPIERLGNGDKVTMIQSTPFVQVPRSKRISDISEYEVNVSPIAPSFGRRSEGVRRSRNLENDMSSSHLETDDFDVEFRKLPLTPNSKTDSSSGAHLLDNEKRISLQHFEDFEKSILESEHNGVDFDEMLNSLTDVKRSMDSVKLRQSLDNIKKRHSRVNSEKQLEELKKRGELNDSSSSLDNKLADSMMRSMSSSSGSERLLNRRSRINDDVHLTLSPQQQQQNSVEASLHELELQSNESKTMDNVNPLPTASEVGSSDRKNRDRFKTIRISKRREEGMIVVPGPEDVEDCDAESASLPVEEELPGSPTVLSSAFSRVDYNSPKESRLSTTNNFDQTKTEDIVFKRPQGIPKPENKIRSLSKPRYYGAAGGGFGLNRKDLSLPLTTKSSSTDNLENDRPNYQQPFSQQQRISMGTKMGSGIGVGSGGISGVGKGAVSNLVQSNLKSPMGTKSKSHHNLYFNQSSHGGSNSNLNRITTPLGLSAQKLSHNNSNTELKNNTSRLQLNLRTPRASSLVRPGTATMKSSVPEITIRSNELNSSSITTTASTLSGVQMRVPKANARLGLVRPSSGYFSYSSNRKNTDSDTESINSLSSSSASSRGSLYRVDSQNIANNVQTCATNSIEDISGSVSVNSGSSLALRSNLIEPNRTAVNPLKSAATAGGGNLAKPSGLRQPSSLRPPTTRSGLPRPTSFVRR